MQRQQLRDPSVHNESQHSQKKIIDVKLTDDEQTVLDAVFAHFRKHGKWIGVRTLQIKLGKELVESVENRKPFRLVWRYTEEGKEVYKLTSQGLFLSNESQSDVRLLVRYLELVKQTVKRNPETEFLKSEEVCAKLKLNELRCRRLLFLIQIAEVCGGCSYTAERWDARPPLDVVDLIQSSSALEYLQNRLKTQIAKSQIPLSTVEPQKRPTLAERFAKIWRVLELHPLLGSVVVTGALGFLTLCYTIFTTYTFGTSNPLEVLRYVFQSSWSVSMSPETIKGNIGLVKTPTGQDSMVVWADHTFDFVCRIDNRVSHALMVSNVELVSSSTGAALEPAGLKIVGEVRVAPNDFFVAPIDPVDLQWNDAFKKSFLRQDHELRIVTDRGEKRIPVQRYVLVFQDRDTLFDKIR
jgi:hypothetical protein